MDNRRRGPKMAGNDPERKRKRPSFRKEGGDGSQGAEKSQPTDMHDQEEDDSTDHDTHNETGESASQQKRQRHYEGTPSGSLQSPAELQPFLPPSTPGATARHKRIKGNFVRRAIPQWMIDCVQVPTGHEDDGHRLIDTVGLDETLVSSLERLGIEQLFPLQVSIVPKIIQGFRLPYHPGDVCVCAPTGSGKTLCYILPILQCLGTRVVPLTRALIVLPTRDLVLQVKRVIDSLLPSSASPDQVPLRVRRAKTFVRPSRLPWRFGDTHS